MSFKTDIEIAQEATPLKITEIAKSCGIDEKYIELYGNYKAKTSHTLNKVPCIIYDNTPAADKYTVKADEGKFGLSNVAATMVNLMGFAAPDMWDESIINVD